MPTIGAMNSSAPIDVARRMQRPVRYLDLLARAVAHVDAHLDEDLTADVLAGHAAMSRHHFHRIFHAYFGTTVFGYVTWRRLQRACELLAAGTMPVLEIALDVGYESPQALAKAMRRELDTTPTAVRAGRLPQWQRLFERRPPVRPGDELPGDPMLKPLKETPGRSQVSLTPSGGLTRSGRFGGAQYIEVPTLPVLTATGRGMDQGDMSRAAKQAYGELVPAVQAADLLVRMKSCIALFPDTPAGPDDQQARFLGGVVFDHSLAERDGVPARPDIPLTGTLAWTRVDPGLCAVFTHIGPYSELHRTWTAIYRDWLPATGHALRDAPPFELYVNDVETTPPEQLRTDIYIPLE